MAFQHKLPAIPPQPFLANGTVDGQVSIAQPGLFKVGQNIVIGSSFLPSLKAAIKRIDSGIIFVGPIDNNPDSRLDISAYGAGSSFIFANEQLRPFIPKDELIPNFRLEDYEFEEEPVVARRSILVDAEGEKIGVVVVSGVRRLAVDTSVSIPSVTITQSGIQNVHVDNVVQVSGVAEQPVRVDNIVQVSGIVDFVRPVDVVVQNPSSPTISGVVQVSGVAEQPVRVDGVVQVSGVVDFVRPVDVVVDNVVQVSGVAEQPVRVDGVVQVSGVVDFVRPVDVVVDNVVQVSGVAEQPVRVDNIVQVSGVVDFVRPVDVVVDNVVQVSGVAEQPVRVDGVVHVSGVVDFVRPVDVVVDNVVQVSGVAEQPVRVDNIVQVSGIVGVIQPVQTTVSGVVAVSGVATQTVFYNRQWLDVESLERQTSIRIDYSGISPIFIGEAPPGSSTSAPVWRIRQIVYVPGPNPSQIIWADGDTNFDNIWDNRASLSYS
jgi:hypothetical protein